MNKIYKIYAYKHYWPPHLDPKSEQYDPDTMDIPVPYEKDRRDFTIEANSEKEAIKIAEIEYGSVERTDSNGQYIDNPDGSWTLMGVSAVEITAEHETEAKASSEPE